MAAKDTTVTTIDDAPEKVPAIKALRIDVTDTGDQMSNQRVSVTLHANEGEAGGQAQFVSVNNAPCLIPRGIPCDLPIEVLHVLDNAVHTIYEAGKDGVMREREVKRFSYTVHPTPTKARK